MNSRLLLIALAIVALSSAASTSADDGCVTYDEMARWVGGMSDGTFCLSIARRNDIVYLPQDNVLRILDVRDPVRPVKLEELVLPAHLNRLRTEGAFLSCGTHAGAVLFDIRDPAAPVTIWQGDPSVTYGFAFSTGYFYLLTDVQLEVYELAVGGEPHLISALEVPTSYHLEVEGNLAFTKQSRTVQCYDVSDPAQVTPRGQIEINGTITSIAVRDDRLFVTWWESNMSGGYLSVVDVSDPDQFVETASIALNCGWVSHLVLDGDLAAVTSGIESYNCGIVLVDVSDPDNPHWLGRCDTIGYPYRAVADRPGELTVGMNRGFGVFDISTHQFINERDFEWAPATAQGVARQDHYLFMATAEGLAVWDISNPLHAVVVVNPLWGYDLRSLHQDGTALFLGSPSGTIHAVSTTDPTSPVRTGSYQAPGIVEAVGSSADWLAAACGYDGLALFERRPGWDIQPVTVLESSLLWGNILSDVRDIAIHGSTLVVGDWVYGVIVFDIEPDGQLRMLSHHRDLAPVSTVAVRGDYIYAAGGNKDTHPAAPTHLHTLGLLRNSSASWLDTQRIPTGPVALKTEGQFLYLGMTNFGVFAYSLSDGPVPVLLGGAATMTPFGNKEVADFCIGTDYVFVAAEDGGLRVLSAHCKKVGQSPVAGISTGRPQKLSLEVSPNPFNPRTTITFDIVYVGAAQLTIHDLTGARVRTLLIGPRAAGRHQVIWDGCDDRGQNLASGVYLARLVVGDMHQSRKIVLVR